MFKSALAIYERLVKDNPEAYVSSLADIQLNLGILYLQTKRYPDSETMLKSALHRDIQLMAMRKGTAKV